MSDPEVLNPREQNAGLVEAEGNCGRQNVLIVARFVTLKGPRLNSVMALPDRSTNVAISNTPRVIDFPNEDCSSRQLSRRLLLNSSA
jgi:hypothetical protein